MYHSSWGNRASGNGTPKQLQKRWLTSSSTSHPPTKKQWRYSAVLAHRIIPPKWIANSRQSQVPGTGMPSFSYFLETAFSSTTGTPFSPVLLLCLILSIVVIVVFWKLQLSQHTWRPMTAAPLLIYSWILLHEHQSKHLTTLLVRQYSKINNFFFRIGWQYFSVLHRFLQSCVLFYSTFGKITLPRFT